MLAAVLLQKATDTGLGLTEAFGGYNVEKWLKMAPELSHLGG